MTVFEFNRLTYEEKFQFVFNDANMRFVTYRKDDEQTISLWDCGSFFIELYVLNKKILKIEGIELDSSRIDLYIEYAKAQSNRNS